VFGNSTWVKLATPVGRAIGHKPTLHYFEMHLADHCNLNCRGCSHYSSVSPQRFADPEQVERDFARLAELFGRVKVIRLMGGEPLLHPQLERFIVSARKYFPKADIALATNGLLVPKEPESFWQLLSSQRIALRVTDYPIKADRESIKSGSVRHGLEWWFSLPTKRFLKVPIFPAGNRDPHEAYRLCRKYAYCPFLRDGSVYPCARIAMSWILTERFGAELPVGYKDRIVLSEAKDGYEVLRLLSDPVPWCRFCGFDVASTFDWEVSRKSANEWLLDDAAPVGRAEARTNDGAPSVGD
jgi:hypothetical protein